MARKPIEINVGQKFREVGTNFLGLPLPMWTVDLVFISADSLKHVRLVNVDDTTERKTLSANVLTDRHRFALESAY